MKSFIKINKPEKYDAGSFVTVGMEDLSSAVGCLKHSGLKMYLYGLRVANGQEWKINPVDYANFIHSESSMSNVSKMIRQGIEELELHGYARAIGGDAYEFSEKPVAAWIKNEGTSKIQNGLNGAQDTAKKWEF